MAYNEAEIEMINTLGALGRGDMDTGKLNAEAFNQAIRDEKPLETALVIANKETDPKLRQALQAGKAIDVEKLDRLLKGEDDSLQLNGKNIKASAALAVILADDNATPEAKAEARIEAKGQALDELQQETIRSQQQLLAQARDAASQATGVVAGAGNQAKAEVETTGTIQVTRVEATGEQERSAITNAANGEKAGVTKEIRRVGFEQQQNVQVEGNRQVNRLTPLVERGEASVVATGQNLRGTQENLDGTERNLDATGDHVIQTDDNRQKAARSAGRAADSEGAAAGSAGVATGAAGVTIWNALKAAGSAFSSALSAGQSAASADKSEGILNENRIVKAEVDGTARAVDYMAKGAADNRDQAQQYAGAAGQSAANAAQHDSSAGRKAVTAKNAAGKATFEADRAAEQRKLAGGYAGRAEEAETATGQRIDNDKNLTTQVKILEKAHKELEAAKIVALPLSGVNLKLVDEKNTKAYGEIFNLAKTDDNKKNATLHGFNGKGYTSLRIQRDKDAVVYVPNPAQNFTVENKLDKGDTVIFNAEKMPKVVNLQRNNSDTDRGQILLLAKEGTALDAKQVGNRVEVKLGNNTITFNNARLSDISLAIRDDTGVSKKTVSLPDMLKAQKDDLAKRTADGINEARAKFNLQRQAVIQAADTDADKDPGKGVISPTEAQNMIVELQRRRYFGDDTKGPVTDMLKEIAKGKDGKYGEQGLSVEEANRRMGEEIAKLPPAQTTPSPKAVAKTGPAAPNQGGR